MVRRPRQAELAGTRTDLQSMIQDLEAANEALQSADAVRHHTMGDPARLQQAFANLTAD